jgi:uncharacterized membrane protein YphA (DoxX/SURF4 family)
LHVYFFQERPRLNATNIRLSCINRSKHLKLKYMKKSTKNYALWTVQVLLALVFLLSGGSKLVLPIAAMTAQVPFPGLFLRFLGVAEVLGAIGLILPWLLNIKPILTPIAALGLVVIMIGATVITVMTTGIVMAIFPLAVGILSAAVAFGRRQYD